jgi:hypothetical protein
MSYWNMRVVKQTAGNGEDWYSVRETHYNDDNTIYAYTEEPVDISGSSIDELREYLQWCLDCLDKPILVDGEVKFVDYYKPCELCNDKFEIPCPACKGNTYFQSDCARCHGKRVIDCPKCCSMDSD